MDTTAPAGRSAQGAAQEAQAAADAENKEPSNFSDDPHDAPPIHICTMAQNDPQQLSSASLSLRRPPTYYSPTSSASSTSSSSSFSSYFSTASIPYPVVFSSPSLIDSVRANTHSPPPQQQLLSSIPPPPFYSPPLPLDSCSSPLSLYSQQPAQASRPAGTSPLVYASLHPHPDLDSSLSFPPALYSSTDLTLHFNHYTQHCDRNSPSLSNNRALAMSTYPPPQLTPASSHGHQQPQSVSPQSHVLTLGETTDGHRPGEDLDAGDASATSTPTPSPSRPRSVVDLALDTASVVNPGGRRVRRNVMGRWQSIPRNARIFLSFSAVMTVAKVLSTIAVLILDRDASCPYLKVILILYAVRSAVGFPFALYANLHPRAQGTPLTTRDVLLERQRTMMEIAGTCLFFLSNYFLFTQAQCRVDAPAVYYLTVVHVILGYIVILIPIILCMAVILCLPLVLRIMRALDLGPVVGVKGATEEMIATIPIVKYRKPVIVASGTAEEIESGNNSTVVDMGESVSGDRVEAEGVGTIPSIPATPATAMVLPVATADAGSQASSRRPKRSIFRIFGRGKLPKPTKESGGSASGQVAGNVQYLTLDDPQDAICAICLCDYEDDEELRKMNCSHFFHKDCVDEWLRLNRCCPLCKRDIEELAGVREPGSGTNVNSGTAAQAAGASSSASSSATATLPSPPALSSSRQAASGLRSGSSGSGTR